jgi:type IV pilus assembly protein PilC
MVITFTRQLYTLIKAGIPLLKALQIIQVQLAAGKFKNAIDQIVFDIQEGKSFSDALTPHPHFFSQFYINMIKAAEVSGMLSAVLKELSEHLTKQQRITRQVQAAFMYPSLVLFMAGAIVLVLFIFVVPIFVKVFQDLGGVLPPMTQFLISISQFTIHWGWLMILSIVVIAFAGIIFSRRSAGQYFFNKLAWKIPVFGHLSHMVHIGRFCRTIGTLLHSGITLTKALDVLQDASSSILLRQAVTDMRVRLEEGMSLSDAMETTAIFPLTLVRMIQVGEESGKITELFLDAAQDYEEEVTCSINGFLSLLEPVLILIMGGVVGFIVISLFFPIFTMSTLVK